MPDDIEQGATWGLVILATIIAAVLAAVVSLGYVILRTAHVL